MLLVMAIEVNLEVRDLLPSMEHLNMDKDFGKHECFGTGYRRGQLKSVTSSSRRLYCTDFFRSLSTFRSSG